MLFEQPYFMTNEDWYTSERGVYRLSDGAPKKARLSYFQYVFDLSYSYQTTLLGGTDREYQDIIDGLLKSYPSEPLTTEEKKLHKKATTIYKEE